MRRTIAACLWLACLASPAAAYVGPGAGLSAVGSVLAFLGVLALLFLGFLWYPVKRVLSSLRGGGAAEADDTDPAE